MRYFAFAFLTLLLTFVATAETPVPHSETLEVTSVTAEVTENPQLVKIIATLSFSNDCLEPDVIFKDSFKSEKEVIYSLRGVSRADKLCLTHYAPVEKKVIVDTVAVEEIAIRDFRVNDLPLDIPPELRR